MQAPTTSRKDGVYAYISLTLRDGSDTLEEDEAEQLIALSDPAEKAGIEVAAGAYLGSAVSSPGTESSELVGIAVAIIVLLFAFGTAAAMPIPILTAIFGLSAGLSLIGLLGHVVSVPSIAATLGTMLGLGVGIDYALFIVTRHRGFMAEGHDVREAAARATATSGGAVLFAGSTVVIALLSLYFSGLPIVRALGYSAAIVVAVSVTTALTLLPAVLSLLGERINSLKLPFGGHPHDDQPHGWARWAREVGKRPWLAAVAGIAILVALALPAARHHPRPARRRPLSEGHADQAVLRPAHEGLRRRVRTARCSSRSSSIRPPSRTRRSSIRSRPSSRSSNSRRSRSTSSRRRRQPSPASRRRPSRPGRRRRNSRSSRSRSSSSNRPQATRG